MKHVFKQCNILNDTYLVILGEIFVINFAKRRRKSPGPEMHAHPFRSTSAASIMRPLSRGRPRDNSAVHGASEDVPGMTYDVPGVSYPIPWTSGDCPQGVRPADGPGTHSLASTGPFSQAAVHRASGLLRFSQSQRGRIMDRKWGCPQYVRNRKLMSRSCPGNATATLLAALTFFVKNKLILL